MRWQINRALEKAKQDGIISLANSLVDYVSNRLFAIHPYYRFTNIYYNLKFGGCSNAIDKDWDCLLILDACRFDAFQNRNNLPGRLESRWSCSSNTSTFLQNNFYTRELHDTIYVTANPKGANLDNNSKPIFHDTFSVLDDWSDNHPTVHPNKVTKVAKQANSEYPHKRLIVHYMQPHAPFIGKKANQLHEKLDALIIPNRLEYKDFDNYGYDVYEDRDDISKEDIYEAYLQSLDIVLKSCEELVNKIEGKTVITADHGELFNEKIGPSGNKVSGHPMYIKSESLNKVPWFVVHNGKRPTIKSENPVEQEQIDEDKIDKQLDYLGYK